MKKVLLVCVALGLMASTASATIIATDPAGDEFSFNSNLDLIQLEANSNNTFFIAFFLLFECCAGTYRQTIDAVALGEGYHYITVRAFR